MAQHTDPVVLSSIQLPCGRVRTGLLGTLVGVLIATVFLSDAALAHPL